MSRIGIYTIALILGGRLLVQSFDVAPLLVFASLLACGIALYIANVLLINFFISKNSPEFANREIAFGDTESWELTAGFGIVPRWVSYLGLWAIASLVASFVFVLWSIAAWIGPGVQSSYKLSSQDESNLMNFARAFQEKRLATLEFNNALESGPVIRTLQKDTVDRLILRYERAFRLSKATKPEVFNLLHPELNSMVRGHFEPAVKLSADALRTGDPILSLESQRHGNAFSDWWDSHRKDLAPLKRVMIMAQNESR